MVSCMRSEVRSYDEIFKLDFVADSETAWVYRDGDSVIKLYKPGYLMMEKAMGIDTFSKIMNAKAIDGLGELVIPSSVIVDSKNNFLGVRSDFVGGISYKNFLNDRMVYNEKNVQDIMRCCEKFEKVLRMANEKNVVFPDFTSYDNIIITDQDSLDIKLIDYEGIQVGNYKTQSISTSLLQRVDKVDMERELIFTPKYMEKGNLLRYTQELNVYIQYVMFFYDLLHTDITKIGTRFNNGMVVSCEMIFDLIGLDDDDICHKVWCLFQQNKKNEFLMDDKYRLLDEYEIVSFDSPLFEVDARRLVRKK